MICPNCSHEHTCPCAHCQKRNPTEKPWIWIDGNTIKCGNCDLTNSADWWADQEFEQYMKEKK